MVEEASPLQWAVELLEEDAFRAHRAAQGPAFLAALFSGTVIALQVHIPDAVCNA